jgi:Zn-dependent M28 family amino/carboxypeptidase
MREQCDFMVNFDMVGNLRPTRADPDTISFALFKRYPWARAISKRQGAGPSDHAPFQRRGIPFVWIFTGTHNRYHEMSDTPATLNYGGMVQISRYALDMILNFDNHVNRDLIRSLPIQQYEP